MRWYSKTVSKVPGTLPVITKKYLSCVSIVHLNADSKKLYGKTLWVNATQVSSSQKQKQQDTTSVLRTSTFSQFHLRGEPALYDSLLKTDLPKSSQVQNNFTDLLPIFWGSILYIRTWIFLWPHAGGFGQVNSIHETHYEWGENQCFAITRRL